MASRILLRLISNSLLPAVVVVIAKVGALVFLIQWFDLAWGVNTLSGFPGINFETLETTAFINSYSNLVMFLAALVGLMWVLAKAYHLHDTHVTPGFVLQLLSWNLTGLLTTSSEVYQQGLVWLSYVWLITLLMGLQVYLGTNYLWIFIFSLAVSLLSTWYLVSDVEREVYGDENYS